MNSPNLGGAGADRQGVSFNSIYFLELILKPLNGVILSRGAAKNLSFETLRCSQGDSLGGFEMSSSTL